MRKLGQCWLCESEVAALLVLLCLAAVPLDSECTTVDYGFVGRFR